MVQSQYLIWAIKMYHMAPILELLPFFQTAKIMPKDYAATAPNEVRRRDRAVTDESWIRAFLSDAPYGALATVSDGRPFINSNLFVYDESANALYIHTARVGRTPANVAEGGRADDRGARVCFSAFEMGRLLPAKEALEFSVEYEGVVVFGRARIVDDGEEAHRALQRLLDKYAPHLHPGRDYRAATDAELARTAVIRMDIESWSGKKKEVPSDFPGAFLYGAELAPDAPTTARPRRSEQGAGEA